MSSVVQNLRRDYSRECGVRDTNHADRSLASAGSQCCNMSNESHRINIFLFFRPEVLFHYNYCKGLRVTDVE